MLIDPAKTAWLILKPLTQAEQKNPPTASQPPLVSVCIPSYNNEDSISATLQSVLSQAYSHIEIIVTDDCSTDKTAAIIESFSDSRLKLVRNEKNLGFGVNWNKAVSLAGGKYVKLLCGDDLIYPECISRQVESLESASNSSAVLAVCNSEIVNANNEVVIRRRPLLSPGLLNGRDAIRKCIRWGTNLIGEPVVGLFKRSEFTRSGMFDATNPYTIDLAFWSSLLKYGNIFVDGRRMAAFRISARSMSAKIGFNQAASYRAFVRQIHGDPAFGVSSADVVAAYFFSFQWCILRNLLINSQPTKQP